MTKVMVRKRSLQKATDEDSVLVYCRKCKQEKKLQDFYSATDTFLDTNGFFSICKECCSDIYVGFYNSQHDLGKAIYMTCRVLNVRYEEPAVEAVKTALVKKEYTEDNRATFGLYKSKILSTMGGSISTKMDSTKIDMRFQFEAAIMPTPELEDFNGIESVTEFWGKGTYTTEDYRFLEKEMADWKASYSCQNKAEEFFLKQICIKALDLEKARIDGSAIEPILKTMQDLLKNAALTPAQQTASSSGKGTETWGVFMKTIEETTPAEYYKDKLLFEDFDGIKKYIANYIIRPMRNWVTGARDFNMVEESTTEYDEIEAQVGGENAESNPTIPEQI